jgi:hypothetical protein
MKYVLMMVILTAGLGLGACGDSNNSTPPNANVAATPQACGTTIPGQYCTNYNPTAYPYTNNLSYGTYGYGYYGASGFAGYGCPLGYQPLYLGSYYGAGYGTYGMGTTTQYTCVVNTYFNGYNSGYTPYYAYGTRWANQKRGPAQACTVGANTCPRGKCLAFSGSNMGYCAR